MQSLDNYYSWLQFSGSKNHRTLNERSWKLNISLTDLETKKYGMTWSLGDRIKIWSQCSFYLFCFYQMQQWLIIKDFSREEFMTFSKNGGSSKPKTTRSIGLVWKDNSLTKGPFLHPQCFPPSQHSGPSHAQTTPTPDWLLLSFMVTGLRPKK